MTDQPIIILPTDVDDPNGYSAKEALDLCGIDRDAMPALADIIEAEWWRIYGDATAEALDVAGYTVIRARGSIGSPEVYAAERRYADGLYEGDGLPVDMVAVAHVAERQFGEWWAANAETLVEQHRPDWLLFDADTAELIGDATDAQVAASAAAKPDGIILVDADGDVIEPGSWAAERIGVRKVYVA